MESISQTCYEMLQKGANRNGDVVFYNHRIPMRKFLRDIEGCATGLAKLNLQKGDVITLYLPSCPQSLAIFYACSKLGLVANIVHPMIPLKLLKEHLKKVNSKVLFFYDLLVRDESTLLPLNQTLVRCSIADYVFFRKPVYKMYVNSIGKRPKDILTYKAFKKKVVPSGIKGAGADTVCYMHSGGTSGIPKIVKLSNDAMNGTARSMIEMYQPCVKNGDYNLATLPIFHAYGLCAAIHTPLCFGCSLILVPQFQPKAVKQYFNKYRITIWSVVPAMLKKMKAQNLYDIKGYKDLDVVWCGGDVLSEAVVEEADAILKKYCARAKLMRGYGLTEVCGVCTVNSYLHYKKGSCGKPMPGCKVQIWDDDNTPLAAGDMGEIVVSSPGNMQGYLDGESCAVQKDNIQWIKTGDIGYLDEDGYLYVVDRKKRSLKIAAVNVFPSAVEQCISKLDFINEVCVVGVKVQSKQYIKAYVTINKPMDAQSVKQQVIDHCSANLIKYSVPQFVEVLQTMPHTPLGKIDFKALQ